MLQASHLFAGLIFTRNNGMNKSNQKKHHNASVQQQPLWNNASFWQWFVFAIAILTYLNTISHGYALDDVISITMNSFTKKGFAGFKDILTKDSFVGFIGNASELSGGRWRPFALITFATEWQFFGQNPGISHVINVVLYALCCLMLFRFLNTFLLKNNLSIAVAASVLFAVHPIHTEVVANIKSRDEILSLFLIISAMYMALQHYRNLKPAYYLMVSLLFYFMALLSKENGVTGLAFVPLLFYVSGNDSFMTSLRKALPFLVVIIFYMVLRVAVIGFTSKQINEVMNAPFLLATPLQALATKLYVLLLYIKLLFVPYPLSYDYSYSQIPYKEITDLWVVVSVLLQIAILAFAFYRIRYKDVLAFALLFYFLSIFIVSNLLVDTGGVLGERFLFQPSVGFVLVVALLLEKAIHLLKFDVQKNSIAILSVTAIVSVPSMLWSHQRNKDWRDDKTLFVADVKTCPNSARTNNGAGTAWILLSDEVKDSTIKLQYLDTAAYLLNRALIIHPTYVDPYLNLGVVYNRKGDAIKAEEMWNKARALNAAHPKLKEFDQVLALMYLNKGNQAAAAPGKDYALAKQYYLRGYRYQQNNSEILYNLGGLYFTIQQFDSARYYWSLNTQFNPKHEGTRQGLNALNALGK
jgi:tetratricopeptide (TPR) repeat protein